MNLVFYESKFIYEFESTWSQPAIVYHNLKYIIWNHLKILWVSRAISFLKTKKLWMKKLVLINSSQGGLGLKTEAHLKLRAHNILARMHSGVGTRTYNSYIRTCTSIWRERTRRATMQKQRGASLIALSLTHMLSAYRDIGSLRLHPAEPVFLSLVCTTHP